jgi:hypothetical protein
VGSSPIASTTKSQVRWYVAWDPSGPPTLNVSNDVSNAGDLLWTRTDGHGGQKDERRGFDPSRIKSGC